MDSNLLWIIFCFGTGISIILFLFTPLAFLILEIIVLIVLGYLICKFFLGHNTFCRNLNRDLELDKESEYDKIINDYEKQERK